MDVAEIRLETAGWEMAQGDEGLSMAALVLPIALDLAVAPAVAVFVSEATKHLHGGMALLGRRLLVVDQDLVDDRHEGSQDRGGPISGQRTRIRLAMLQDMPDRFA